VKVISYSLPHLRPEALKPFHFSTLLSYFYQGNTDLFASIELAYFLLKNTHYTVQRVHVFPLRDIAEAQKSLNESLAISSQVDLNQ